MGARAAETARVRAAWQGRITGCMLGKAVELLSFREGRQGLTEYLRAAGAYPLRDYVPLLAGTVVADAAPRCCRERIVQAEADDDIDYTLLALLLLERHGGDFETADVARMWLSHLAAGNVWTAERAAYRTLLARMDDEFVNGEPPGFDLAACSDNEFNEWIGGQIRADLYGWVCPGRPGLAADLARRDAGLTHRGDGLDAAAFVAAFGAAIPEVDNLDAAMEAGLAQLPHDSGAAAAVRFGRSLAGRRDAADRLHEEYSDFPPVHALNNLALVVWALFSAEGDFSAAVGDAVAAGWDTDCNGATVGALCGLWSADVPGRWTECWQGIVRHGLAGYDAFDIDDLVARTVAVSQELT